MKKNVAITIISILTVAAIALGVLYFTNDADKTKQIEGLLADVSDRDSQIQSLSLDIKDRDGQIEGLNADVAEKAGQIETLNANVVDKAGQIEKLDADVAEKAGQIEKLNAEVAEKGSQIEKLDTEVADKVGQIKALNKDVAEKKGRIEALNADVAKKKGQIEILNADVADKATQIENLSAEIIEKTGQIEGLKADVDTKDKKIAALEKDLVDKVSQIKRLNTDNIEKAGEIDKLQSEISTGQKEKEVLTAKIEEDKKTIEGLQNSLKTKETEQAATEKEEREIKASIKKQLEDVVLTVKERNTSTVVLKPVTIKNDTAYSFSYVSLSLRLYDADNDQITNVPIIFDNAIEPGEEQASKIITLFEKNLDHVDFDYYLRVGSKAYKDVVVPKKQISWKELVNESDKGNSGMVETVGSNAPVKSDSSENDDKGILFQDIPWGISDEKYFENLVEKGLFSNKSTFRHWYFCLYPGDAKIFSMFSEDVGTTRVNESQKLGAMSSQIPLKTFGGLKCKTCDVCYSYDLMPVDNHEKNGLYVNTPDGKELFVADSHVFSVVLTFESGQKGNGLLDDLKAKYGVPVIQKSNGYQASVWSEENTKLVYYMGKKGEACALWYINVAMSDMIKEKLDNLAPKEMGDVGV